MPRSIVWSIGLSALLAGATFSQNITSPATSTLSKTTDSRSGEKTMRSTNISRAEPDPALFQAPPDYTVVDEAGPFSSSLSR